MTIDTQRLRRIGHAVGLECGHNTGEMIKAAAGQIDALAAEIERLRKVLTAYANPENWTEDANGWQRLWLEPGSSTRESYDGKELAFAALSQGEPE